MEITTCEQYVIDRIKTLENSDVKKDYQIQQLQELLSDQVKALQLVASLIEVREVNDKTDDERKVRLELSIWSNYDEDNYNALLTAFKAVDIDLLKNLESDED